MRGDAGRCGEMRGDLELEGRRGGLLYLSSHLPPASPHTSALEARGGPVQPDGRSREDAASAALRCTRSARTRDTCTHSRTLVPSHKSAQPQARTRRSRRSPFTRRDVYSHKHSAPSAQGHTRTGRRERTETATDTSLCTSQGRGTSAARDHPRSPEIARVGRGHLCRHARRVGVHAALPLPRPNRVAGGVVWVSRGRHGAGRLRHGRLHCRGRLALHARPLPRRQAGRRLL
mmetsp:Transcript_14077/g.41702  ORF Transcript_14077/g.41702 Transcript_14077/m.41702 type:complete len:232 (+) Transcript_14077:2-697(+)